MHTRRMTSALLPARGVLALALAGALALSGCSGSDDKPSASGGSSSGSASSSAKPYLPVPSGVKLTTPGSSLKVGDHAVVAYHVRQGQVGALDLQVTRLEKTSFKKSFAGWKLDKATLKTNPYFVRASVKNVGTTDLGGRAVPLYIVDGHNTLIEASSFASTFAPCPSGQFPKKFKPGAQADVCLVYLSPNHGKLTAASFRPTQEFAPITWTGALVAPKAAQAKKSAQKNAKKNQKR
jgi:hypothetical protein